MPKYDATPTFGDPVPVQAGDIVQNTGSYMILICAITPAADEDAVEVRPNRGITISEATEIRVRSAGRHGGAFKVIRGL
ncbi:hypothetical protein [Paracoccus pantotrophus]|uniref:hypothetical protein n=1 Tax=Paracoccus pantotrophus TaxID=82367 RepID=UPI0004921EF3|nr:hypothetical protein [Paracoccus pantotrophus]